MDTLLQQLGALVILVTAPAFVPPNLSPPSQAVLELPVHSHHPRIKLGCLFFDL